MYSFIPYDRSNPLTYCINGRFQVKDLPAEERDAFVKEFQEKQATISRQVVEFTFKSRRQVTSVEEMSELERQQWLIFLGHEKAELLEDLEDITNVDFFNTEYEEFHGYNEELYIDTWEWSLGSDKILLTDIYGWPGDNQSGGIFIGTDLVFENSDTRVDFPRISDDYVRRPNDKYPMLNQRKNALSHLKNELFCTETCEREHCKQQVLLSEK